jgi:diadenosine tetraphosphate (Ap4A) HIT family hydrolase
MSTVNQCNLCDWVEAGRQHPRYLKESEAAIWLAGEHQFYRGYIVLISKAHVREIFDGPCEFQMQLFQEIQKAGLWIKSHFNLRKLNVASLGNIEEHLHWHLFPRSSLEEDPLSHPWNNAAKFKDYATTADDVAFLRSLLV